MTDADVETSSAAYARRFEGAVGRWFLDVQARVTLELLRPRAGTSVLDVGGGHAQLTGPLLAAGCQVTVYGSAEACRDRVPFFPEGFADRRYRPDGARQPQRGVPGAQPQQRRREAIALRPDMDPQGLKVLRGREDPLASDQPSHLHPERQEGDQIDHAERAQEDPAREGVRGAAVRPAHDPLERGFDRRHDRLHGS